jgi:hypothetical protein
MIYSKRGLITLTLIVVKELFKTPVLIGDVLVSSTPIHPEKRSFPTQPPNKLLDSEKTFKNYLPSNTYRKVYIISDNFAVGFAGDVGGAAKLMRRIFTAFAGQSMTLELWEKFITSQHSHTSNFTLIGWIVENEKRSAFRWESKSPSHLAKGNQYYAGSGEEEARRIFREPESYTTPTTDDTEKALLCSLDHISTLIAFELLIASNLEKLFGLCYELILYNGNKFIYVDDVNYLHYYFNWHADRPDKLEGGIAKFRIHYKNFGDYSCCTISNHRYEPHIDGFLVIKPIFGEKAQEKWAPAKSLYHRFDSQYFCNFVFIDGSDGKHMKKGFIVERGSSYLPIQYQEEGHETHISMKKDYSYILHLYLNYRAEG